LRVARTAAETATWCERYRAAGLSVGFVPTMGALHAGHAALLAAARRECDRVVASIFVNPTQFGPGEDLASYPRPLEEDLEVLRDAGVALAFLGDAGDMYPPDFQTWVQVERLSAPLCGRSRPGHFRGVATVVTQLLATVRPHRAYFGEKDFQQARVVERLARDLHLHLEIRTCPTVREPDGLALSSRNRRLGPQERRTASRIHAALRSARALVLGGETDAARIRDALRDALRPAPPAAPGADIEIDYAEVLRADTLQEPPGGVVRRSPGGILLAVAARIGRTRLIDNIVIPPEDASAGPEGAGPP
jgi:pantoate--beta-alanine ligase